MRGARDAGRPGHDVRADDVRQWVSFADPDEDRTWLFDLTFLTGSWSCLFGRGCQGVLTEPAPELGLGCCSYGAHLTGEDDARRIEQLADALGPAQWQYRSRALRRRPDGTSGPLKRSPGKPIMTRLADDACIFLNRPGFPGGAGCALHLAALADGVDPMRYKPDVCWQLPLRREDEVESNGHVVSRVTQWQRRHWGATGAEFAWWCSEEPAAYDAPTPLYRRMEPELRELCGDAVVDLLIALLAGRPAGTTPSVGDPLTRTGASSAIGLPAEAALSSPRRARRS